ncbi:MAG: hypothetical protein ABR526_05255 [Chthoniobacterales bacterium]
MTNRAILRFGCAIGIALSCFAALNLFDNWSLEENPVRFVAAAMASGIAALFAINAFPQSLTPRRQMMLLWAVGIAFRVIALPLEPGDDFWRYQWEGKIQTAGFNPYTDAPNDSKLSDLREEFPAWSKMNHPDFSAIYPPGIELIFRALSAVAATPLVYKLLFAAADLATVALLLRLIGGPGRFAIAAAYAWNPLVVYSFAGAAHFDSLMLLPLVAGVLVLVRFEAAQDGRKKWLLAFAVAALFGVAISIKLIPLLLLPLCVFALRLRSPALALSAAIPSLLSTCYGWPQVPIWDSLRRFAYVTRLNDLFWWIVEETIWPNPRQKNYHYNVVVIAVVVLLSVLFWRNWRRGMLWVMGAALILTPVLHPWYCTWILPLAAWRRVAAWQVLSVSLFAYYLFWNERLFALPWHAELWMRALIILPPVIALLVSARRSVTLAEHPTLP